MSVCVCVCVSLKILVELVDLINHQIIMQLRRQFIFIDARGVRGTTRSVDWFETSLGQEWVKKANEQQKQQQVMKVESN